MSKRSKRSKKTYYDRAKDKEINRVHLENAPDWMKSVDWIQVTDYEKATVHLNNKGESQTIINTGYGSTITTEEKPSLYNKFKTWLYKSLKAMLNQK